MILLHILINLIHTSDTFLPEYTISVIRHINTLIDSNNYSLINFKKDTVHTVLIDESFISIKIIDGNGSSLHELVHTTTKNETLRNIYDILINKITEDSVLIVSQIGGNIISIGDVLIILNKSYKNYLTNFVLYNSLDKFYIKKSVGYHEYNNVIHFNMINILNKDIYKLVRWSTSDIDFFKEFLINYLIKDPRWNIQSYDITRDFIEYMAVYKFILRYLSKKPEDFFDFSKVFKKDLDRIELFPYLLSKKKLIVKKRECLLIEDDTSDVVPFLIHDFSCIDFIIHYISALDNMPVYERNLFILMFYSISIRDEYLLFLYNILSSSSHFKFFVMTSILYLLDVLEYEDISKYSKILMYEHKQVYYLKDIPKNNLLFELITRIKKNMPEKDSPLKMLFIILFYESIGEQLFLYEGNSYFLKYLHILLRNLPLEAYSSNTLNEDLFKPDSLYLDINTEDLYGRSIYYRILSDFNVLKDIIDKFINNQLFVINNILLENIYFEFNGPSHLSRVTLDDNKKIYKKFAQWLE